MRGLSAVELLRVWEQGLEQTPVDRALALLEAACVDSAHQSPAEFSVGERDAHLLALREQTFGPEIQAFARCAQCGRELELRFAANDVRVQSEEPAQHSMTLTDGEYDVRFRLPNCEDLRKAQASPADAGETMQLLLQRCVLESRLGETEVSVRHLPDGVIARISERMAE